MKRQSLIPAIALFFLLQSCGNHDSAKGETSKTKLTEEEQKIVLTENDLYDGEKIRLYLLKDTLNAAASNQLFLKGLDLFKNKKKPTEAIPLFVTSILRYPTAKAYYELANAKMNIGYHHDALDAYDMAEKLNYEPFAKVLYNKACALSNMEEYELSARYLEYAVEAGYANIDNIYKDPDLKKLRDERGYLFTEHLNTALAGLSNVENIFWLQYKKHFTQGKLPMSFNNLVSETRFDMENAISYDYERFVPQMRDDKFSREVSKGFYYFAQIKETAEYVAVVYLIRDEFMGDAAPLSYVLVTYSPTGKIIDQTLIAGRNDYADVLRLATINKDLTISIELMETEFEKDVEEEGYYDNPIKSKTKVGEELFRIDEHGKLVRENSTETPESVS